MHNILEYGDRIQTCILVDDNKEQSATIEEHMIIYLTALSVAIIAWRGDVNFPISTTLS